jgi:nitroreductase
MKNDFSQAMDFRHACKLFDENRKLSDEEVDFILEAGRKSPSSFGQEPWKFLVVTNETLKATLRPLCWNQPQITSCSHLIVILAAIDTVKPDSGIPAKRFGRRPLPSEQIDAYIKLYSTHLSDTLSTDEKTYAWTARQCYIAAANMMTGAASIGIDSCPMEGFEKEKIEATLELDTTQWQVALLLPFGHRSNAQSEQLRLPLEEVVEYLS